MTPKLDNFGKIAGLQSCNSGRFFGVRPDSGLSLSKCFGLTSGLAYTFFCNDGHFCRQLLLKQSSWLNLQ